MSEVDEIFIKRGFTRTFARCGWERGDDFVGDNVIIRLPIETLRLIATKEETDGKAR